MHILLTQIKGESTEIISFNTADFQGAKVTDGGTRIYTHTGNPILVAEPIAFIINAVNHQVRLYYVKPGDTLTEVAQSLGVTLEHLWICNPSVRGLNTISTIQVLKY
ncbi:hypothetical protein [Providencia phage PSTCR6]|nr:hypothetical protein [Providencia phage PSTCR6]